MKWDIMRIVITCVAGGILSGVLGLGLLPVLRALKAGQSVHKIGPTWHNSKVGTPLMGGLMFIGAVLVCLLVNLFTVRNYTVYYSLGFALCFALIGFLDDFCKVKFKKILKTFSLPMCYNVRKGHRISVQTVGAGIPRPSRRPSRINGRWW